MTTQVTIGYEHGKAVAGMKEFASEADRTGGRLDHLQGDIRDVQAITEVFGKEAGETAALILRMSGSVGQAQKSFEQYMIANAKASGALKNFGKEAANAAGSIGGTDLTMAALTKRFLTFEVAKQVVGSALGYLNKQFQMTAEEGVEPFQLSLEYAWGQLDKLATGTNNWQIERTNEKLKAATEKRKQMVLEEEKAYKALIEDFSKQVMGKAAEDRAKLFAEGFKDLPQIAEARKAEIDHVRRLADEGKLTEETKAQATAKVVALDQRRDELLQKQKDSVKAAADLESAMVESVRKDRLAAGAEQLKTLDQVREYEQAMVQRAKELAEAHRFDEKAQKAFATEMAVLEERKNKLQQEGEEAKKKASDEAKEAAKREVEDLREKHHRLLEYIEAGKRLKSFDEKRLKELETEERRLAKLRTDYIDIESDRKTNAHKAEMDRLQKENEARQKQLNAFRVVADKSLGDVMDQILGKGMDGLQGIAQSNQDRGTAARETMGGGGFAGTSGSDIITGNRNKRNPFRNQLLTPSMPLISMQIPQGLGMEIDLTQFMGLGGDATAGMPTGAPAFGPDGRRLTAEERRSAARIARENRKTVAQDLRRTPGMTPEQAEATRRRNAQMVKDAGGDAFAVATAYNVDPRMQQRDMLRTRDKAADDAAKKAFPGDDRLSVNRRRRRAKSLKRKNRLDIQRGAASPEEQAAALGKEMKIVIDRMGDFEGVSKDAQKAMKDLADELEKGVKDILEARMRLAAGFGNGIPQQQAPAGGGRPFNRAAAQQAGRGG